MHHELDEDGQTLQNGHLDAEDAEENESPGQEGDHQGSYKWGRNSSSKKAVRINHDQTSRQTSHSKLKRKITRQKSRGLMRQASREAVKMQKKNGQYHSFCEYAAHFRNRPTSLVS